MAYLEILLAAPEQDQMMADVVLHPAGHIEIEVLEAPLHQDLLLLAEHRAMRTADLRIAGIDGGLREGHRVDILADDPAQALVVKRTLVEETHQIVTHLLSHNLLLQLGGRQVLLFSFLCLHRDKGTNNM